MDDWTVDCRTRQATRRGYSSGEIAARLEHISQEEAKTEADRLAEEIRQVKLGQNRPGFDELISQGQAELDYLDTVVGTIDGMNAGQVRDVVKRLAMENRRIIRVLLYVIAALKINGR